MSLVDDWDLDAAELHTGGAGDPYASPFDYGPADAGLDTLGDGMGTGQLSRERPIFSVEIVERNIARGRGAVSAVAAASDCVVVGTTRGYLLRYDFSQGTAPVSELELSKAGAASVSAVFLDPAAQHVLACVSTDVVLENHYVHAKWKKSRLMSKLKGVAVTAVGWNDGRVDEHTTGPMLVGTAHGVLAELLVEEKDKREKHFKHLYTLGGGQEPVNAVEVRTSGGRTVVMAVTPTRLYLFAGDPSLETLFATYNNRKMPISALIELPGDETHSSQLFVDHEHDSFAWLAQPGIYHGRISHPKSAAKWNEADFMGHHELLPFPEDSRHPEAPFSMASTEHHFLLLYKSKLLAINKVSKHVIQSVPLVGGAARGLSGTPMGLAVDTASASIFMFTGEALHEVSIREESRDMWKIYLLQGDYEQAAAHCDSSEQKNIVWTEQAEAAFEAGEHMAAARLFARLGTAQPTFEQVALRFVEISNPAALHEFLTRKLEALTADDRAQATMVATWLTELQLDQINQALLNEEGEGGTECQGLIEQLRTFLTDYKDVLDETTTSGLLASYGRLDELLHFAAMHDDNETVIEHLMQRGEVSRALGVLRRPNVSLELVYKFAPVLIVASPTATVDAWIHNAHKLNTRRLMPALLRCDEPAATAMCRNEGLRYIEYCIHHLHSDDTALHNLAVSLYAAKADETDLLAYLKQAKGPLGAPCYDAKFALRLSRGRNRERACVQLLSDMGMYQDATALAIKVDVELAKQVAELPEDDAPLRRKLWLSIARHLVESQPGVGDQRQRIRQAVNFLKETNGLLKIEDILPFFPDFVMIDEFKDAICSSLEEYNRQIEDLKTEMDVATEIADVLRKDLAACEQTVAVVDLETACERCGRSLAAGAPASAGPAGPPSAPGVPGPTGCLPPFYVFPCKSAFHSACLLQEVKELQGAAKGDRISRLAAQLMAAEPGAATAPAADGESAAALRRQLDELVATECPRCGEGVVRLIDKPLIEAGDAEVEGWSI